LKNNRFAGLFCISMFLCALSFPAKVEAAAADSTRAPSTAHPALWIQAVQILESSKDLVPGKALQKIQELDDKGGVKSQTNVEISIAPDEAGNIKSDIVKASKDGKDITGEEKKKAAEREKKEAAAAKKAAKEDRESDSDERSHSFSMDDGPFNAERQSDVRVTETRTRETIDGMSCVCFEFSYPEKQKGKARSKGTPATVKGTAWIDEGSGHPMKVEFTMEPLPKHVKNLRTTMQYGTDASGPWVLKQMVFEAHGAFLVFAKRIRGDMLFSDYWKYEKRSQ